MSTTFPARLLRVVDALPLSPGVRVLEIGGAPAAAAVEVARRVALTGHVLVLDRSPTGIQRTRQNCQDQVGAGLLTTMCASVEEFTLPAGVEVFDIAFACRVGALDGRHMNLYDDAIRNIAAAPKPNGHLYIDTGNPLRRIDLH